MRQLVKLFFEFTADDLNDAGIELEEYFAGKYDGRNTVGLQTSVEEASELVEELLDDDARSSDLDAIFNEFNVQVTKVEIRVGKAIKNNNFRENRTRKSYKKPIRETSLDKDNPEEAVRLVQYKLWHIVDSDNLNVDFEYPHITLCYCKDETLIDTFKNFAKEAAVKYHVKPEIKTWSNRLGLFAEAYFYNYGE